MLIYIQSTERSDDVLVNNIKLYIYIFKKEQKDYNNWSIVSIWHVPSQSSALQENGTNDTKTVYLRPLVCFGISMKVMKQSYK